jgi:hypothetical protein
MTQMDVSGRSRPLDRWPTGLAVVVIAGAVMVIALVGREAELFGPAIATMAGIYLVAYASGRPWAAWPGFLVLSAVVSVFHVLSLAPAVGMTAVLAVLWLWAVVRRRYADRRTFTIQTAGMLGFGVLTLVCAAVQPQLGAALAGIGFLAHGAWDAYHFRTGTVVNRPWSEFCAVVDAGVGVALIVAAVAGS